MEAVEAVEAVGEEEAATVTEGVKRAADVAD